MLLCPRRVKGSDALLANCQGTLLMNFYAGRGTGQRSIKGQSTKLPSAASSPPHGSDSFRLISSLEETFVMGKCLMPF